MMKRIYLIMNHKILNEIMRVEALTNLVKMREVKHTAEMDKGLLTILELFGNPFDQIESYEKQFRKLDPVNETVEENEDGTVQIRPSRKGL